MALMNEQLEAAASAAPLGSMQYNGLLGDYIGGVFGTAIAAITFLVVLAAWWTTRRNDSKTKIYEVFAEMLRTHEEIISSIELAGVKGREAFSIILSEFSFIYKTTRNLVPSDTIWSMHQRIDVAYTYTYYGPQLQTQRILKQHDPAMLKLVGDAISKKQQSNANSKNARHRQRLFKGHQNRLSHYFRNLFAAYSFIESSNLSEKEKRSLSKVLRAKLSNYEQALLLLNTMAHLGEEWKHSGLLAKYKPIKNVPKNFFSFDEANFILKNEFPYIVFEWEAPLSNAVRS